MKSLVSLAKRCAYCNEPFRITEQGVEALSADDKLVCNEFCAQRLNARDIAGVFVYRLRHDICILELHHPPCPGQEANSSSWEFPASSRLLFLP
jgi:hypothetical protein